jgi:hypothetical protein
LEQDRFTKDKQIFNQKDQKLKKTASFEKNYLTIIIIFVFYIYDYFTNTRGLK